MANLVRPDGRAGRAPHSPRVCFPSALLYCPDATVFVNAPLWSFSERRCQLRLQQQWPVPVSALHRWLVQQVKLTQPASVYVDTRFSSVHAPVHSPVASQAQLHWFSMRIRHDGAAQTELLSGATWWNTRRLLLPAHLEAVWQWRRAC